MAAQDMAVENEGLKVYQKNAEVLKELPTDLDLTVKLLSFEPRFKSGQRFGAIPGTKYEGFTPKELSGLINDLNSEIKKDPNFLGNFSLINFVHKNKNLANLDQVSLALLEVTHYFAGQSESAGSYFWTEERNLREKLKNKFRQIKEKDHSQRQALKTEHLYGAPAQIRLGPAIVLGFTTLAVAATAFKGFAPMLVNPDSKHGYAPAQITSRSLPTTIDVAPTPIITSTAVSQETVNSYHPFEGQTYSYDAQTQHLVDSIKQKFGVTITSPKEYDGKENLQWDDNSIKYVVEGISRLPPSYLNTPGGPKEILLIRTKGTTNEGAGGGYTSGRLILVISETFNPEAPFSYAPYQQIYGKNGIQLQAAMLHEWTHAFTLFMNPKTQEQWNQMMGWHLVRTHKDGMPKDIWVNDHPEELQSLIYGNGHPDNPWEDIAVSVEQMLANPQSLPQDRFLFFLISPDYQGWQR